MGVNILYTGSLCILGFMYPDDVVIHSLDEDSLLNASPLFNITDSIPLGLP